MEFAFNEELQQFVDSVRRFLMIEATPELAREQWSSATGRCAALWTRLAAQGLTSVLVPDDCGGLGLSEIEWAPLAQECGYFGLAEPLLDTALVAAGMLRDCRAAAPDGATRERCGRWLQRIAEGGARVAVAHPAQVVVADAHVADAILCAHGGALHLVAPAAVKLVPRVSLDPSRRLHEMAWTPGADSLLLPDAVPLWDAALNRGALGVAAQMLGLAQRMLDIAIDYSIQRKQFGKAIGTNQALKHLLADVAIALEFAKPVVYRAAHALARADAAAGLHVSHALLAATRAALLAARHAMQVHGAMGYTWELDLQIFMKRAWALADSWGDRAYHKARVAADILGARVPLGAGATFAAAARAANPDSFSSQAQ